MAIEVTPRVELVWDALRGRGFDPRLPPDVNQATSTIMDWLFGSRAQQNEKQFIDAGNVINKWVEEDPDRYTPIR
jgi:hypothetical protein